MSDQGIDLSAAEQRAREAAERTRRGIDEDLARHREQQEQRRRATEALRQRRPDTERFFREKP